MEGGRKVVGGAGSAKGQECRVTMGTAPVDINRFSSRSTATAAHLKTPPPPGSFGSSIGGRLSIGGMNPGVRGLIAPSQRPRECADFGFEA